MAAKKRNKKVTYNEFLAWLEGVESMQPADWTPTNDQWKTIRAKLDNVKPDVEVREIETTVAAPMATSARAPGAIAPGQLMETSSAFEAPAQPAPRMQLSAHQQVPSEHEGVPAATTGPHLTADGTLPSENEFL